MNKWFPKTLIVELTNFCPFECPHCYVKKTPARFLTQDILTTSLRKINRKYIKKIILHGGEPFTMPLDKIQHIVDIIREDFLLKEEIHITSNPDYFFNPDGFRERLDFLTEYKVILDISLDKYRKFWKNKKEAFNRLTYIKKNGVKCNIIVTLINNTNYTWLLDLLKDLISNELIEDIAWEREIPILSKNNNSYVNHHDFFDTLERLMHDFTELFGKSSLIKYFPFFLIAKEYKIIPMIGCSPFCIDGNIVIGVDGMISCCTKNQLATKIPFRNKKPIDDICKNCKLFPYCKSRCLWLPADDGSGECIAGKNHIPWDKFLTI